MTAPGPEQIRAALAAQLAARGYVLPHHGLMAAALPDLAAAYGPMYAALTVTPNHLAPLEREAVWLALLLADAQSVGTHHLALFRAHGGTDAMARGLLRLAGHATAPYAFVARAWQAELPALPGAAEYFAAADALAPDLPPGLARMALAAIHTLRRAA
jgi:hypothetical protein